MKFILLAYNEEDSWRDGEREEYLARSIRLCRELQKDAKYVNAAPLHPTTTATSVRVRSGRRLLTDGPFAETREQLGGFYLIEAEGMEEAIAIAGRIPSAWKGTIEVRPLVELS